MTDVTVGGVVQRLWFRGMNAGSPAVILLHGGPGTSETALFRHFNADLERHFLMVYWDQRGTGRSYRRGIPTATMTIDQFVRDLDEVVEIVRHRFGKARVVLLGHSWGTALGIVYAARFPDKVAAYVGIGQVADMREGERLSYQYARSEARRREHRSAMQALDRIGEPPHTVDEMLTSRKWVERFGGSFHGDMSTGKLIWAALGTDEAKSDRPDQVRSGATVSPLITCGTSFEALTPTITSPRSEYPSSFCSGGPTGRDTSILAHDTSRRSKRR